MTILLSTNNLHKKKELDLLFQRFCPWITLKLPVEKGFRGWDEQEKGNSFLENALGKAHTLFSHAKERFPVLADDSGLCVDVLDGKPGTLSARWGQKPLGRKLSDQEKNQLLLRQIPNNASRIARFVCALALVMARHRVFTVEEVWEGEIAFEESLQGGFGYDPIFYLPDQKMTAAELGIEKKNLLSHRGKAAKTMAIFLKLLIPKTS